MDAITDREVALVTGASRGIGRAIAQALAASGRFVLINYKSNEAAARETLEAIGGQGALCPFDVASREAAEAAVKAAIAAHGRLDIVVNNAGIRKDGLLAMMSAGAWHDVIAANLDSFFHVVKPAVRHMQSRRQGRIVSIASTAGQIGSAGQVNYSAAKAGLIGASKALAREVAKRNVTVNVVAPGFTETEMLEGLPVDEIVKIVPMERLGRPEEVAAAVLYFCSPAAAYTTGQVLGVNGGIC